MNLNIPKPWRSLLIRYGTAIVATLLATLLRELLDPILEHRAPFSAYYAAVMFTAWYGGLGPSLLALVSGAVLADYFFIEPRLSLFTSNLEQQVSLGLFVAVGVVVAVLSESLHASRRRTKRPVPNWLRPTAGLQKEIAERQQAEQWLLESEQRFRGYFEQGLVGMAMLSAERDWIEANRRLCQMLGYSEQELMSKKWAELVHPDDQPGDEVRFKQMLGRTSSKATSRINASSARMARYCKPAFPCSACGSPMAPWIASWSWFRTLPNANRRRMWRPLPDRNFRSKRGSGASKRRRKWLRSGPLSIIRHFPGATVRIWTAPGNLAVLGRGWPCPKLLARRHLRFLSEIYRIWYGECSTIGGTQNLLV